LANLPEKTGHIVLAGQKGEIHIDDDAIEAMIKPLQIRLKKLKKVWHGRRCFEFVFCRTKSRRGSHAFQASEPAKPFIQPKMFEIFAEGDRQPIQTENQRRLPLAVLKISNIFGWV
jgi:hypothetical protein